ncbi:MAG: hypothetical protein IKW28_08330 [Lachnospiraceae bacterium]|nr:hypothetical protein [Lachnospiraceae bacterium]
MRVTEKLLLQNNQKNNKKITDSSEEETLTYQQRNRRQSINDAQKNRFVGNMNQGINKRESIFDRTATFRTHTNTTGREA